MEEAVLSSTKQYLAVLSEYYHLHVVHILNSIEQNGLQVPFLPQKC